MPSSRAGDDEDATCAGEERMSEGRCARRPQLPPAAAVGALAPPPDTIDQLRGPANTREQLRAPQAGAGCGQRPAHPPPVQQRLRSTGGGRTAQTRYTTEPPRRRPRWQCGHSAAQRASAARQIQLRRLSADARQCASWSLSQALTCRNWFPEHACPRNWHPIKVARPKMRLANKTGGLPERTRTRHLHSKRGVSWAAATCTATHGSKLWKLRVAARLRWGGTQ